MSKGSVRKKGRKWYYRFYVEDNFGNRIQKEYVGTESKRETEKMLRKAMYDYETTKLVTQTTNITLGQLLDIWVEEDLKPGSMSNGTVELYQNIVKLIKRHPICKRKLTAITSEHLQKFMDQVSFGGKEGDFDSHEGFRNDYAKKPYTVLNHVFRFAVFPKRYVSFNPMQYVVLHKQKEESEIFGDTNGAEENITPITWEMYRKLIEYLDAHHPDAVLPVQISYYTGLRIGEVCGLTWQDINLDDQYITVRRSIAYDTQRHKVQIGTTKRAKIRIVDFGDCLADILSEAYRRQQVNEKENGDRYHKCYYKEVKERSRVYYEYYHLDKTEPIPEDYHEMDFICRKGDGTLVRPGTLSSLCWRLAKIIPGFENFHFHILRHTYTTNLLTNGAKPKDVQELLGHSSVNTTMDIYAHATRESKKACAKLLDGLSE